MKALITRNIDLSGIFVIFLVAELLIWPMGNFPLNDDWSYTKSVNILIKEGWVYIGDWPAMTLVTHLLWGGLFVKIFGFSFFILRLSTLISAFIGVWVLRKLLLKLGATRSAAFTGALVLLLNPVYMNVSNTFMTDVNFNTLFVIACYLVHGYLHTFKRSYLVAIAVVSVLVTLLRQFGLIVPFAFLFSVLFVPGARWKSVAAAAVVCLVVLFSLWWFEKYIAGTLSPLASYKYILHPGPAGNSNAGFNPEVIWSHFTQRTLRSLLFVIYFLFPVTLPAAVALFRRYSARIATPVALASVAASWFFFNDVKFLMGNIFVEMAVGPDTFYQQGTMDIADMRPPHGRYDGFTLFTKITGWLFASAAVFCVLMLPFVIRKNMISGRISWWMFFCALTLGYLFMLIYSNSWFDRYHLPLITLGILIFALSGPLSRCVRLPLSLVPMALFAYAAVAGTHDYFLINRTKWSVYDRLRFEHDIPGTQIHAGFEVMYWDGGENTWWQDYVTLNNRNFLVQYDKHPKFRVISKVPFKRWFPVTADTLLIQERIEK